MKGFDYENKNTGTFLIYSPQQGDELDGFTLGMLSNNSIPGILPVQFVQVNNQRQFIYNVTAKVSLSQYIAGGITRRRCLDVLRGIAGTVHRCNDYMLDRSSLIYQTDYIFVDVSTCELSMICLPIVREQTIVDMTSYFRILLSTMLFSAEENMEYPAKILNMINGKGSIEVPPNKGWRSRTKGATYTTESSFSLEKFIKQLDKLSAEQAADSSVVQSDLLANKNPKGEGLVKDPKHIKGDHKAPNRRKGILTQTEWVPQDHQPERAQNESTSDSFLTSEFLDSKHSYREWHAGFGRESEFFTSGLDTFDTTSELAKPGSKTFRGLFGLFRRIKERQNEKVETNVPDDLHSVFEKYQSNDIPLSFGDTTYLGDVQTPDETMILSEIKFQERVSDIAYLTRESTNETIEIVSVIFKIGKERQYVDYFIGDNPTVSRSHADILRKENRFYIIDNNSTNHTYIDGEIIPSGKEILLEDGAEIMLGNEKLTFHCRSTKK